MKHHTIIYENSFKTSRCSKVIFWVTFMTKYTGYQSIIILTK